MSLLITVFDMSNLPQATGANGADGSGGTVGVPNLPDTDPRSLAAKTRLRLLCYDPKNNATGTLIIDAKTTLQVITPRTDIYSPVHAHALTSSRLYPHTPRVSTRHAIRSN